MCAPSRSGRRRRADLAQRCREALEVEWFLNDGRDAQVFGQELTFGTIVYQQHNPHSMRQHRESVTMLFGKQSGEVGRIKDRNGRRLLVSGVRDHFGDRSAAHRRQALIGEGLRQDGSQGIVSLSPG